MIANRCHASRSSYAMGSSDTLPLVSTIGRAELVEQQVVQRRVREHEPRATACRGPPMAQRRLDPSRDQHDRPAMIREQRGLDGVEVGKATGRVEVGHHEREGLLFAMLAGAQRVTAPSSLARVARW